MSVRVTTGKGAYFTDPEYARVWLESLASGVPMLWYGRWRGQVQLPDPPTVEGLGRLIAGQDLPRVQANRVGVYDVTFAESKRVTLVACLDPPDRVADRWLKPMVGLDWKVLGPALEKATIRRDGGRVPADLRVVPFTHLEDAWMKAFFHRHWAVPNTAFAADGRAGSVGNARDVLFREQGHLSALRDNLTVDLLRERGVPLAARPDGRVEPDLERVIGAENARKLLAELSPGKEARDGYLARMGVNTPAARDLAARLARADAPPDARGAGVHATVEQTQRLAARYGLTREALDRHGPEPFPPAAKQKQLAYELAVRARDKLDGEQVFVTEGQFLARMHQLRGVTPVRAEVVEREGRHFLRTRAVSGYDAHRDDDQVFYSTGRSRENLREAFKGCVRDPAFELVREQLQRAARAAVDALNRAADRSDRPKDRAEPDRNPQRPPDVRRADSRDRQSADRQSQKADRDDRRRTAEAKPGRRNPAEARADGKPGVEGRRQEGARGGRREGPEVEAGRGLLKAGWQKLKVQLFVLTAAAADAVRERLAGWLRDTGRPKTVGLDGRDAPQFLRDYRPRSAALWAHAKSVVKGVGWGLLHLQNPHRMMGRAEQEFAYERCCRRLPPGSHLVVEHPEVLTPRQRDAVQAIARRDGAHVIFVAARHADRDRGRQQDDQQRKSRPEPGRDR
ncbi:MAG: hypothetical protein K2X87_11045 [Gemmataceae bacterium]|nr:hypothetical protein [Gemmataceae bacterium]